MDILICDDEPLAIERLARLVSQLGHRRGRSDGINGSNFTEQVSNVSCRIVAITSDEFFFFCHNDMELNVMLLKGVKNFR